MSVQLSGGGGEEVPTFQLTGGTYLGQGKGRDTYLGQGGRGTYLGWGRGTELGWEEGVPSLDGGTTPPVRTGIDRTA